MNKKTCAAYVSFRAATCALGLALCTANVGAADTSQSASDIEIPQKWESAAPSTPEATELAARCMGMPESELRRITSDASGNKVVTQSRKDLTKPYLVVSSKRVICVQKSSNGFPILPFAAFQSTINFDSVSPEQLAAYHTSLSRQLARRGSAVVLVKTELGTAFLINYLFAANPPFKMYYSLSFLKKGEFDAQKFESVFEWSSFGPVSVKARGEPSEQSKALISDE